VSAAPESAPEPASGLPPALAAFAGLDLRVGTVRSARENSAARDPALVLEVDLGPQLGTRISSAQVTANHEVGELVGQQVVVLCGLPPKRVAGVRSEVLVLAAVCPERGNVLLAPQSPVADGSPVA